jgi:hypothetical protein
MSDTMHIFVNHKKTGLEKVEKFSPEEVYIVFKPDSAVSYTKEMATDVTAEYNNNHELVSIRVYDKDLEIDHEIMD